MVGTCLGILLACCPPLRSFTWRQRALAAFLMTIGFMWGGEISYGRQFWAVFAPETPTNALWLAFLQLALMGAAWGGISGMGMASGIDLEMPPRRKTLLWIGFILFWVLTLVAGFGRYIWISFLISIAIFLIPHAKNREWKRMASITLHPMIGMGFGFLVSGILLFVAGRVAIDFVVEIFKLRDQVIGLFLGITMAQLAHSISHKKNVPSRLSSPDLPSAFLLSLLLANSFSMCLYNLLQKWYMIGWITGSLYWKLTLFCVTLGAFIFISLMRKQLTEKILLNHLALWSGLLILMAILKEPLKWELGYTILIVSWFAFVFLVQKMAGFKKT